MATVNLYNGKHINYQGRDAVVVSNNYSDNTITLMLNNGEMVTVSKNESIFNANKTVTAVIDGTQRHIESLDKEIEEGEAKIKESNKLWSAAVENIRKFKNDINTLLNSLGVKSENQITDSKAREEYKELSESVSGAKKVRNRASSNVLWFVHKVLDAIFHRHDCQLMQSVAENFTR